MAENETRWRNGDERYHRWDEDRDRWRRMEGADDRSGGYRDYGGGDYGPAYGDYSRNPYGPGRDVWNYGAGYRGGYGPSGYYGGPPGYYGRYYAPGYYAGWHGPGYYGGPYPGGHYGPAYGARERDERGWWDRTADEVSSWFGDEEAERRRRMDERYGGPHRGRGPKGYRRSDERIREDVSDRLTDDAWLDASDIEVSVDTGEVTLNGGVDTRVGKRRAEDLADEVSGVTHVQNNLRVRPQGAASGVTAGTTATSTRTGLGGTSVGEGGEAGQTGEGTDAGRGKA